MDSTHYWDGLATKWDAILADGSTQPNTQESFRRFHWFMTRQLTPGNRTASFRLLDLGAGTGEASWPLWKRVSSVTFMDRSPAMLRLARNKFSKGIFVRGEAERLPFLDAEFDIIVSRGGLISTLDEASIPLFLDGVWRVLRARGTFLFDFVCNEPAWLGPSGTRSLGGPGPSNGIQSPYRHWWNRTRMLQLLGTHLPGATIVAYDGKDAHALNRIIIRKT
jgi:ubiquinone/menaquinone biosynthesis C-methylase UbiE